MISNLHLIIGIQGSGKTEYAKTLKDKYENCFILEKDAYFPLSYAQFCKKIKDEIISIVNENNSKNFNFIVVATFLTEENRKLLLDSLKNLSKKICYYHNISETDFNNCQINVLRRQYKNYSKFFFSKEEMKEIKDPHIFPISVMFSSRKKYMLPKKQEGFNELVIFETHKPTFDPTLYKNKALFLDYDGTLRTSKGIKPYPLKIEDIEINQNIKDKIKHYEKNEYILLGISNQSGIGKKELTISDAIICFEETNKLLSCTIDYMFCPHNSFPISCYCRKPQVGLLLFLIEKYKINPEKSFFIGDMKTDKTLANKLNISFQFAKDF